MARQIFLALAVAYLLLSFSATAAWAAALTNLDQKAYTFNASISGEIEEITLAPGQTWRIHAGVPVYLYADNGKLTIEPDEEYSIWKGGKILLQKRVNVGSHDN